MDIKIGLIIGLIRNNRVGPLVADWVFKETLQIKEDNVSLALVELKDFDLPLIGLNPSEEQNYALNN